MGKPVDVELSGGAGDLEIAGGRGRGGTGGRACGAIGRAVSFRCVLVLLLAAGVLIPALFLLVPSRKEGYLSDDPDVLASEIKVGFTLEKPASFLNAHIDKLGSDIFEEIGVPNSKVSIVSMRPLTSKYSTHVVFGVLPYPKDASISLPALSVLRSSLIEMMLQQVNLSLTPSLFGHPSSFELLRFPGGIDVIPAQSGSIWADPLFNFVLNNSIYQILGNLTELKDQLKLGLNLRSYEKIILQLRNEIGSSVEAPATVEASVLDGSSNLLPDRLKQLAKLISKLNARNLGLNHSVFGKVKGVQLSSYLQHKISDLSPSPSPSPSPSTYPSASPSPSPTPSFSPFGSIPYPAPPTYMNPSLPPQASPPLWSRHPCFPCSTCNRIPPAGSPMVKSPCIDRDPRLPPFRHSPEPSVVPSPPTFPPVPAHVDPPRPLPTPNHFPKTAPGPTSQMMPIPSPSLPVFQHSVPPRKKRNRRTSKFPSIAPSPYVLHT
ncbi:uncharacterized protein LOC133901872 [Phragmites australis]|uniref:uncharacterized protein LOC133901872 n=1 Tax=Phragmites australis TaxID=29695 RepID=UPI002D782772|nr:uncharacterized protein LOC133901872 [Phragmites australis]